MAITKAIIPAAGLGTRLRPVTEILPKELLPIGTKPSLYFVLEEAYESGLKEIVLVISQSKKKFLTHLEATFPKLKFHFVIQKEALGLGHAVGLGEKIVGDEAFLVLLPDVLIDHPKPVSLQLIEAFRKTKKSLNASRRAPKNILHLYGVYEIASSRGRFHLAKRVVEKPAPSRAPSDRVVVGRYLFTPDFFAIQKKAKPGYGGEIQLADAMNTMARQGNLVAYEFEGRHLDIGNPLGMLQAQIYYGAKKYGKQIYKRFF